MSLGELTNVAGQQLVSVQISTLAVLFLFIIPGVIAVQIYRLLVPAQPRDFASSLIEIVTYGAINAAAWSWLPVALDLPMMARDTPSRLLALGVVVMFISPIVLAYVLFRLLSWRWLQAVLSIRSPSPAGWDEFFTRGQSCLMIFHLKNGEKVGGAFGEASAASHFPNPQQVYVEQLWFVDEESNLTGKVPRTLGGIINMSDCDWIEFVSLVDKDEASEQSHGQRDGTSLNSSEEEIDGQENTEDR